VLRIVDELIWALRRAGLPISTAQAIDVARVVALVGFDDRLRLRDAVALVVVDRLRDRPCFDDAWARFFDPARAHPTDLFGRLRERGYSEGELDALRELLDAAAAQSGLGDAQAIAALTRAEGELDRILAAAGIQRTLAPMTSPLQAGFFTHRVLDQLQVPALARALSRIRAALREALGQRGAELGDALDEELALVGRRVRAHVEDSLRRRRSDDADPQDRRRLADAPFALLSEAEIADVRRAVRRLAERLRGAERVRQRRARHGRIDVRRTMRASLRTGGVPFHPARTRRRRDKPRLILLCDVSESVRAASLFMLEFVYAAQDLFAATRSFVFVSDLGETTALFASTPIHAALRRIYGGHVVSLAHNSNYGRALRAFEERHGKDVDRRTTVVILGDGRTNHHDDEAELVRRLRDRSRAVLWLCPETEASWGSTDSAMPRYAAAVTQVLRARTAAELELAAREVALRRG
jgi:uncharacterized protein with von Willebrand factor type A (vWA) domain